MYCVYYELYYEVNLLVYSLLPGTDKKIILIRWQKMNFSHRSEDKESARRRMELIDFVTVEEVDELTSMEGIEGLSLNKGYGDNTTESVEASFTNILKQVSMENPHRSVRIGIGFLSLAITAAAGLNPANFDSFC